MEWALDSLAHSVGTSAADLLGMLLTWWLGSSSRVDVGTPVLGRLNQLTLPVIAVILTVSVLAQAVRMVLSRRRDPAVDVALGLARYAVVTGVGLTLIRLGLDAGDELSQGLLQDSLPAFTERLRNIVTSAGDISPWLLLNGAGLLFGLSLIQWVLLFFRQAGILVLATMLPLAASGAIAGATRGWLRKIIPWLVALVVYKPVAAIIYTIGMSLVGQGNDFSTVMVGIMILALAVVALPVMMRFFSWSELSVGGGGSGGGTLAAAATGAASIASMRAGRNMELTGPGSATGSGGGPGGGSGAGAAGGPGAGRPALPAGAGGAGTGAGPGGGGGGGSSTGTGVAATGATSGSAPAGAGAAGSGAAAGGGAAAAGAAGGPAGTAAAAAQQAAGAARAAVDSATAPPESGPAGPSGAGPSAPGPGR